LNSAQLDHVLGKFHVKRYLLVTINFHAFFCKQSFSSHLWANAKKRVFIRHCIEFCNIFASTIFVSNYRPCIAGRHTWFHLSSGIFAGKRA